MFGGFRIYYFLVVWSLFSFSCLKAQSVAKHCSSYYTIQKVRDASDNVRRYAWARQEKDEACSRADAWLNAYDLTMLWKMIPSQKIPRSYAVNSLKGCLVCGTRINKYGNYAYLYDKTRQNWKLTCPSCHLTFPTNDFASYYKGGLDTKGKFIPSKAKACNDSLLARGEKGYLVNRYAIDGLSARQIDDLRRAGVSDSTIHRITTDTSWGVDDGYGYLFNPSDKTKFGDPYTYVAYYAHWALWYKRFMPMLLDFSKASLLTRYSADKRERTKSQLYADAAIVMLDRIADLYPELHVSEFPRNNYYGFPNNGFKWHTQISAGRIVGSIWENELVKDMMFAYDAVFPAISTLSSSARSVLSRQTGLSDKGNADSIRLNFERGVLREVPKAFAEGDLQGNPGMQQSSLALAAVVINHAPETSRWLDTVFRNGNSDWASSARRDGGSVMRYMVNRVSRDGQGDEVSIAYNAGWLANWSVIAKILDGYRIPGAAKLACGADIDLYHNQRYMQLMKNNYPYLLTDNYVPHIGDTSLTGCPGYKGNPDYDIINPDNLILAYHKCPSVELAQAIYLLKNKQLDSIHSDIFSHNPEQIKKDIRGVISRYGELRLPSSNFSAYGLAVLRDEAAHKSAATDKAQRALWMFYGSRSASHNHADPLNLGYIAYDLDLMPDFGYPNTLGGDLNPEQQWDKSTPAHNTVSFDDLGYRGHIVGYGHPLHFDDTGFVKLIHASAPGVQNGNVSRAEQYERTSALIRIDSRNAYIVDLFRVTGRKGYSYTFNFHTAEVNPAATSYNGLTFDSAQSTTYNTNTLRNVRNADTSSSSFSIDWNVLDTWNRYHRGRRAATDVHLKISMLDNDGKVRIGEAVPPTNNGNNPSWVPVLMVPRVGQTTFTSIIEAYKNRSNISSVVSLPVVDSNGHIADSMVVKAVRVKLSDGRTDYIVNSLDTKHQYRVGGKFSFCGFFGVYSEDAAGKPLFKYINDGTLIAGKTAVARLEGTVTDATATLSSSNSVVISADGVISPGLLKNQYVYIDNSDIKETPDQMKYNAVYHIRSASRLDNHHYRLDLGDCSVIRGWKDVNHYSAGFNRDFSIGASCYIPLSSSSSK